MGKRQISETRNKFIHLKAWIPGHLMDSTRVGGTQRSSQKMDSEKVLALGASSPLNKQSCQNQIPWPSSSAPGCDVCLWKLAVGHYISGKIASQRHSLKTLKTPNWTLPPSKEILLYSQGSEFIWSHNLLLSVERELLITNGRVRGEVQEGGRMTAISLPSGTGEKERWEFPLACFLGLQ